MQSLFAVTFVMHCGSASSRWRQVSKDCRTSSLGITFFRKLLSWEIKKKEREVFLQNGLEGTEKVPLCLLLLRGFEILARVQCLQCCDLSGDGAVAPPDLRASWGWDVKDSATGVRVPQEPPLFYTLESALVGPGLFVSGSFPAGEPVATRATLIPHPTPLLLFILYIYHFAKCFGNIQPPQAGATVFSF